jgi:GntR family transcriptional regulator
LARELAVNQNTILRVYERLTAEGLLERRHGDGTYVAQARVRGQLKAQRNLLRREVDRLVQRAATLGLDADDVRALVDRAFEGLGGRSGHSKGKRT